MTVAARMTRSPRAHDPDTGGEAAAQFADMGPEIAGLIGGAAGCSPYLCDLLRREGDWIRGALDDPERARDDVLSGLAELSEEALKPGLRAGKRRIALLAALCDLAGVWPLETVTQALTDLGDAATDVALRRLVASEVRRGKLPGISEADAEQGRAGLVALAMGKMGAGELNYSSDIDLIVLFDETRFDRADFPEARAGFIRAVRKMTSVLSDMTADGYVFRTDLRLRPDASVTPVAMAMAAAEAYYESVGRTWERAAYIKARAAAGDIAAGEAFLQTLTPFVWRKHLDFAAIQDAHDMRLRIREHKGLGGPITLPGHDMKLGRGGIREIEFFTQTRQLIAGGRDETLRVRGTVEGLERLRSAGWVPGDVARTLSEHYRAHREVEHRLQMIRDAQTQALPGSEDGFERLAAFMGTETAALKAELHARLEEVHELTEGFFAPGQTETEEDGFGAEVTARWPGYPALRSDRAVAIFNRLKPEILKRLKTATRPEEALAQFDGFLRGLPAGVQLFSLFEANPQLTQLVVDICATAPALASYLSRNAAVFDAVIGGGFFADWPGRDALRDDLAEAMAGAEDYEAALDTVRRLSKEWHFRVGVHHLRGLIDAREAGRQYADLAEAVLASVWPIVVEHFAAKHGPPPGRGAVVLGMGSLGARRLHAASDLDVIVIYDAAGAASSEGRRPLAARAYYARLTQALVTAVTAPTAEGRLYELDMRLRPSGRQGPVATGWDSFRSYQRTEAWTWEHLALTRARPVAGASDLARDVEDFRAALLGEKSGGAAIRGDVRDMRARIAGAKSPGGPLEAKIGPGRLQDIELAAQSMALMAGEPSRRLRPQLAAGVAAGLLNDADRAALAAAAGFFWSLQSAGRLLSGDALDPDTLGEGGRQFVLSQTGMADMRALAARAEELASRAAAIIDTCLEEGEARDDG